ncbi:uncharacterized protein SEPMUDRAFT_118387 [Sphaerulina musiva SO2202]|uniref:Arrestin-like N-terminal domain-containing protein n=1 Tax=Sphaerulina musiva (strain SO2202) TaxID=692275 RepID=M3BUR4_SPHMS|nr:uncharacterized protein SEPMUDRAFT_118387 [Sphaerulina musiva SO2202]EMF11079.1 hypothetical protein SEPMUDRAFT_118387 [Sphaerulina musiva SO2202]
MPPRWRSSQAVDARIFIGQDDDATSRIDTRTFWGPEPITGKARFYSKKPLTGLRCRIIVQGSVKTRTIDDASQSMSSNANHEAHTFLSHVLCECENIHLRTEIELPFAFNLQHLPRASYLTTTSTLSQQLLPSLDSKNAQRHWSDAFKSGSTAYYEITYTLIASAHVENKLISSTTKMFHYVPTLTSPPTSFPVEDFPEDYTLRVNKILQSQPGGTPLTLSSSSSRLGIITQEPPPKKKKKKKSLPTP